MIKFLVVLGFLSYSKAVYTPGPTGTTVAFPSQCSKEIIGRYRDNCATFGGFYERIEFGGSYANIYIECFEGDSERMICRSCAPSHEGRELYYSEDCDRCVYKEDLYKECPTTAPWIAPTTLPISDVCENLENFCKTKETGNHPMNEAIPENEYVTCVHKIKHCRRCPSTLVYDKTCDACNSKALALKAYESGGHAN